MWKKIIASIFVLLVAVFLAAFFYLPKIAENNLYQAFQKADSASFARLEINFWEGDILLTDFYISDTLGKMVKTPVHGQIEILQIRHVDVWKLFFTRRIYADSVFAGPGNLSLILPKKSAFTGSQKKLKLAQIKSFFIAHVQLDSLVVAVQFEPGDTGTRMAAELNFVATNVSATKGDLSQFDTEKIQVNLHNLMVQNNAGISVYTVGNLAFHSGQNKMVLNAIKIRQRIKKGDYARHFGYDKLHFEVDADSIILTDLPTIHEMVNRLHVPRIDVYKPLANLYKDRRFFHKPHPRKFPFEVVYDLPFSMRVDSVIIHRGTLFFQEKTRNGGRTAKLDLQDVEAKISNVSTEGENELGFWTTVAAELKFYNQLPFTFIWKFDLRQNGQTFLFDGTYGRAPLSLFNPFLKNKTNVIFERGTFLGGRILVEGNKNSGEGTLDFYYKNMRLKWLKREDRGNDLGHFLAGTAANLFMKNNNLPGENPKRGIIYAEPIHDRFIISFLWRLMQAGVQDVVLTSKNAQKAGKRKNQYLKDVKR